MLLFSDSKTSELRSRNAWARLLSSSILLASSGVASAQSAAQIVPPTREEVTRPVTAQPVNRAPQLEVEGGIERAPCALDGPEYKSIHFVLRGAEFDGLQAMTREQLAAAYAPFVGRDVPISVVCEIRDRAGTMLRDAGYIAAVQVPEQKIGDGIVHFRVLMAHVTQVRVRGDATGAEKLIAGYLSKIAEQPVFNRYQAERYLLLASDLPGYLVRLTLRPAGTVPGDVIGDVTVQRSTAYADFNVQNGGSRELGRWGGLVRAQVFGLTGLGDRTSLSVFSTSDLKEQQTVQLAHDFHLGPEGLSISEAFTYAWAKPSLGPDAHVIAHTLLNTFEVGYPLVRTEAQTIRASAGLDLVNQSVDLNGIALTRDKLRVGFLRLGIDAADTKFTQAGYSSLEPPWRLTALVELRQGLHALGATGDCGPLGINCLGAGDVPPSRVEGHSDATLIRYTAYGEYRPVPKLTFALGARGQYSSQPLLSFEEFSAGNYTAGRGYDPGALLGDSGFGSQAEVRYGTRIPASAKRAAVEGYGFWDHAEVRNRDRLVVLPGSEHLDSIGGGARINFDRFVIDASIAVPLTRVGIDDKRPDPRFLFSLTSRLWPWSYQ